MNPIEILPRKDPPHVVHPNGTIHSLDIDTPLALWMGLAVLGVWVPRTWIVRHDKLCRLHEDGNWYEIDWFYQALPSELAEGVRIGSAMLEHLRRPDGALIDPRGTRRTLDKTIDRIRQHLVWLGDPPMPKDVPWSPEP